ncbi:RNase H family protein [Intestinibacter sp.]|uniref:RNase H family protein n=1 Tax=Intestinibacter sp. TaxID=1965304 RepID=UPI002A76587E|nr:RNase H family protein [Intestinibacter sp.]MDY2734423.1 RNase H family protein [Intestinibacter sp.]
MKQIREVNIYVDGSFSREKNKYSYGCVALAEGRIIKFGGTGDDKDYVELWNIAGELFGSMEAIKWAVNNGYDRVTIYHDYIGLEKWASRKWRANKVGTKKYVEFIEEFKKYIDIKFVKVKAHSGNVYNEEADKLAKRYLYTIEIPAQWLGGLPK